MFPRSSLSKSQHVDGTGFDQARLADAALLRARDGNTTFSLTGALKLTGGLPQLNDAERERHDSKRVDAGMARSLTLVR